MSKFTRQDVIRILNKVLPPSSTQIHQPGELSEFVQLVQTALPRSWAIDQWGNESVAGVVGTPTVDHSTVGVGRFRWYQSAHVLKTAGGGPHVGQISVVGPTNIANTICQFPITGQGADQWPAGYLGPVAWFDRPVLVPPNYKVRGGVALTLPDAAINLTLELQWIEFLIGDEFPA